MPETIPSLWPNSIKVDIKQPLTILRMQAGILRRITKGVLDAEVTTTTSSNGHVQHDLDVIAPALSYRHRLLSVSHTEELVYPVALEAECFDYEGSRFEYLQKHGRSPGVQKASTEEEFLQLIGMALQSKETLAVVQSLLARSNDPLAVPSDEPPLEGESTEPPPEAFHPVV